MNQQENLLAKMISEIADYAVLLMDTDGTIKTWNIGAERIKGYKSDEIIGKSFRSFYTDEDRESGKPDQLIQTAKNQGRAQDEGWRVRKDGSKFWGSVVITCVHDEQGELTGFSKVTRDLTERREAEIALRKNALEIEHKNREMEQFVYVASHDLQEPLRTVRSLSEFLASKCDEKSDPESGEMITYMNQAVGRMTQLVQGLLDYSRIGRESEPKKINLNSLISDLLFDLKSSIESSNATVKVENLPTIMIYEVELRVLFQNLISNAIKFCNSDRTPIINIGYAKEKSYHKFWVQDNGIGIPKEHYQRIFSIFQKLHPKSEYEGAGIGLAHCLKIAQLHGGTIWVESTEKKGSIFYLTVNNKLSQETRNHD